MGEHWQRYRLVAEIDEAVASPYYRQAELSELLANAGVLPMFGFPTRVRELWRRWVEIARRPGDVQPSATGRSTKPSPTSRLAPRSSAKGEIHTAPASPPTTSRATRPSAIDPLGEAIQLIRCESCGATSIRERRGAAGGMHSVRRDRSPMFRSTSHSGSEPPTASATTTTWPKGWGSVGFPQLAMGPRGAKQTEVVGAMRIQRSDEPVRVIRINDNRGALFPLLQLWDKSVVSDDESLYDQMPKFKRRGVDTARPGSHRRGASNRCRRAHPRRRRPACRRRPDEHASCCPPGFRRCGRSPRSSDEVCQVALDLQPDELQVGLQPTSIKDFETRRVFLADKLENGAGYAPELGRSANLKAILDEILGGLARGVRVRRCTPTAPMHAPTASGAGTTGASTVRSTGGSPSMSQLWPPVKSFRSHGGSREAHCWPTRSCRPTGRQSAATWRRWPGYSPSSVMIVAAPSSSGHPLWLHQPAFFNEMQADAYDILRTEEGIRARRCLGPVRAPSNAGESLQPPARCVLTSPPARPGSDRSGLAVAGEHPSGVRTASCLQRGTRLSSSGADPAPSACSAMPHMRVTERCDAAEANGSPDERGRRSEIADLWNSMVSGGAERLAAAWSPSEPPPA